MQRVTARTKIILGLTIAGVTAAEFILIDREKIRRSC